jgi:hypothetical protein
VYLMLLSLPACSAGPAPATAPSAGQAQGAAEIVIQVSPQSVQISIGQTLVATSVGMRWMATFDEIVLGLVSPVGRDENASSNEWRFRGRAAGTTDVTFTGDVAVPCATPPNCPPPPAPPTVVVHVQVTP